MLPLCAEDCDLKSEEVIGRIWKKILWLGSEHVEHIVMMQRFGGKNKIKSRCYWWKSFCPELKRLQYKTTGGPCSTYTVMCSGFVTKITLWTEKTLGYYLFFIAFLLKSGQNLISKYLFKPNSTRLITAGKRNKVVLIHFQCIQLFLRSSTLLYTYLTSSFLGFQLWETLPINLFWIDCQICRSQKNTASTFLLKAWPSLI